MQLPNNPLLRSLFYTSVIAAALGSIILFRSLGSDDQNIYWSNLREKWHWFGCFFAICFIINIFAFGKNSTDKTE